MITLHHLENSRSLKIAWLLEELDIQYEIKHYKRNPVTMMAPNQLKNIHPIGKSPIITDENGALAESGAIIEYILEFYNGEHLIPSKSEKPSFIKYKFFMHYAEGSVMPILVMSLIFNKIESTKVPFFIKPIIKLLVKNVRSSYITPTSQTHFNYIESVLAKQKWITGDHFTAADIQIGFALLSVASKKNFLDAYPNINRYVNQIEERATYIKAIKKIGPLKF